MKRRSGSTERAASHRLHLDDSKRSVFAMSRHCHHVITTVHPTHRHLLHQSSAHPYLAFAMSLELNCRLNSDLDLLRLPHDLFRRT